MRYPLLRRRTTPSLGAHLARVVTAGLVSTTIIFTSAGLASADSGIPNMSSLGGDHVLGRGDSVQQYVNLPIHAVGTVNGTVLAAGDLAVPGGLSVRVRACDRPWTPGAAGICTGTQVPIAERGDLSTPVGWRPLQVSQGTTEYLRFDLGLPNDAPEYLQGHNAHATAIFTLPDSDDHDSANNSEHNRHDTGLDEAKKNDTGHGTTAHGDNNTHPGSGDNENPIHSALAYLSSAARFLTTGIHNSLTKLVEGTRYLATTGHPILALLIIAATLITFGYDVYRRNVKRDNVEE